MTERELVEKVIKWRKAHGIDNPYRQLNKITEELADMSDIEDMSEWED